MERVRRVRTTTVSQEPAKPSPQLELPTDDEDDDSQDEGPRAGETPMQAGDRIEAKYRARATTPLKAIRAHCVTCMGCQPKMVAGCTAYSCILYPFRMGTSPYMKRG